MQSQYCRKKGKISSIRTLLLYTVSPFTPSLSPLTKLWSEGYSLYTPYNLFTTDSWSGSAGGAFPFLFAYFDPFCYSTGFALSVIRDFLSIGGAIGKVTPLAGPGLSRPWKWYLKVELSGLGVSEFWEKVSLWVVFLWVFKTLWGLYCSSKMLERPKATIFSHNSTTWDNERHK